jgi:hypothetical protein
MQPTMTGAAQPSTGPRPMTGDDVDRTAYLQALIDAANAQAQPRGQVTAGNIDLYNRPVVKNSDGTISTVRSMSIGTDQGEVLIPTVSPDGRIMGADEAIDLYRRTGQHLGIFRTPQDATSYAETLHQQQADLYGKHKR